MAALTDLVRTGGGTSHTNATARQITIQEGQATGVMLHGGHHEPADLVLVSGGAREAFLELLGRAHLPAGFVDRVEVVHRIAECERGRCRARPCRDTQGGAADPKPRVSLIPGTSNAVRRKDRHKNSKR